MKTPRKKSAKPLKVLLFTDLRIGPEQLFWHRDLGLLTKAFRQLGHDAWLVVHPALESLSKIKHQKSNPKKAPVIWASASDVRSPSWWQGHKPDLVILGLWTRPKYDPIRRAALSATPRVIERADSDGMRTASCGLLTYAKRRYDYFRDRSYRWPSLISIFSSFLYSFASILATPWIEMRLARTLKILPAVTVETPHATSLWKRLSVGLGCDPERIHWIPHPIRTDIFKTDSKIQKKNQIISVGRWESYQKNLPLLIKILISFLRENPSWTALVVGSGLHKPSPQERIIFSPPLPAAELARRMQESKFYLSVSRFESFGLATAEAGSCGCIVFLTRNLASVWPQGKAEHADLCLTHHGTINLLNCICFWRGKAKSGFFTPTRVAKAFLASRP